MLPTPPDAIGRAQYFESTKGNDEVKAITSRRTMQNIPPSSPPQTRNQPPEQFRPHLQPPNLRTSTGLHEWENHKGFSMDALEVGAPRPRRPTEQTSHDTAQQALAAMRRDEYHFASNERHYQQDRRDSLLVDSASVKKPAPPKNKKRAVSREARPDLQNLAATQLSLFQQPPANTASSMLPPPLPDKSYERHYETPQEPEPPIVGISWPVYADPKALTSSAPMCDDPRLRMLKIDVVPDQPNVISPTFMIALPFGTLIEGASEYSQVIDSD